MAATLITSCPVDYRILNKADGNGHYSFEDGPDGPSETLRFLVAWEDVPAFRAWAKGKTTVVGGNTVRDAPLSGLFTAGVFASRIRGQGVGSNGTVTNSRLFTHCLIDIDFAPLKYDPTTGGPFQSVRYRASTSFATVPGAALHFSNGEYIDHDWGVLLGQYAIEVTQYQIPDINALMATLKPIVGKVNSDPVTIEGTLYAPGYLLIPTFDGEQTISVTGSRQEQATLNIIFRSIGWNRDIRSDGVVDDVVPAPYPTAPMAGLFQ